jgi:hypothetical protein
VHFSGGAAASYSLFDLDTGKLGCSGNAVAYGGYVLAKDFVKLFQTNFPDNPITPSIQLMFQRTGGCMTLPGQ